MEDGYLTYHRVKSLDVTLENAGRSFESVKLLVTYNRYDGSEGEFEMSLFPETESSVLVITDIELGGDAPDS